MSEQQDIENEIYKTCARSHPHEGMTDMCFLRTRIARLENQAVHREAKLAKAESALDTAEQSLKFIHWQMGMKDVPERVRNVICGECDKALAEIRGDK